MGFLYVFSSFFFFFKLDILFDRDAERGDSALDFQNIVTADTSNM